MVSHRVYLCKKSTSLTVLLVEPQKYDTPTPGAMATPFITLLPQGIGISKYIYKISVFRIVARCREWHFIGSYLLKALSVRGMIFFYSKKSK